jgi:nucleoside-diphosphate-sugar epimerase
MDMAADIRRAAADLNWRPKVSLRDGLAATIAAMRA